MKRKHWIILGAIGLGIVAIAVSATAKSSEEAILITDHDTVYDYQFKEGRWYTRRKGTEVWIDMQTALSPQNYNLAVSRLTAHLNR